jgi:hypothetical protein
MSDIIFNVAAKIFIAFTPASVVLIREIQNNQTVTIPYSSGTGQTLTAGQVLFTAGTPGQPGYMQITASGNTTITGTGSFSVQISAIPTSTVPDGNVTFVIDESNVVINIDYQSKPVVNDIVKSIANRAVYTFTAADFDNPEFSDFDGQVAATDVMIGTDSEIASNAIIPNYLYNGNPYVAGTWIPYANVGNLVYTGANQNNAYAQNNKWRARDAQGNISI